MVCRRFARDACRRLRPPPHTPRRAASSHGRGQGDARQAGDHGCVAGGQLHGAACGEEAHKQAKGRCLAALLSACAWLAGRGRGGCLAPLGGSSTPECPYHPCRDRAWRPALRSVARRAAREGRLSLGGAAERAARTHPFERRCGALSRPRARVACREGRSNHPRHADFGPVGCCASARAARAEERPVPPARAPAETRRARALVARADASRQRPTPYGSPRIASPRGTRASAAGDGSPDASRATRPPLLGAHSHRGDHPVCAAARKACSLLTL